MVALSSHGARFLDLAMRYITLPRHKDWQAVHQVYPGVKVGTAAEVSRVWDSEVKLGALRAD